MPNRLIREGWIDSPKIDGLDPQAERFFLRLCLKADDFGRFHANPQLLKSLLFPLKEDARSADMSRHLAACEKAGLVRCYDVAGKRFVEIINFGQRSRAKTSKYPAMQDACTSNDGQMTVICQASAHGDGDGDGDGDGKTDAGRKPAALSDEDWLKSLEQDPAYAGIQVQTEHAKMQRWCDVNRKQASRRRFINWLNRIEKPMQRLLTTRSGREIESAGDAR